MIAAGMLYALAASLLLTLAAGAADRAARALGRATRWVWAVAMAASLLLPAAAWWWRPAAPAPAAAPAFDLAALASDAGHAATPATPALELLLARATLRVTPGAAWSALDVPLAGAWAAGSLLLLLSLALAQRRLRRARREWRPAMVHGAPVLVAGRTGPAVAGVWRTAVVLPEWALAADAALLGLMLAHEREHQRAADPRLLALATLAVALMPWNLALWCQRHRLRLAVEIDCDRRVLRRHPDVARYGALLLEVGRRAVAAPPLPLAALTSTTSSLERRIRIMTTRRPRHALARGLALLGASALAATAALAMPRPAQPPAQNQLRATSQPPDIIERARRLVRERMPELLGETTDESLVLGVLVDADGRIVEASYEHVARGDADPGLQASAEHGLVTGDERRAASGVLASLGDLAPDAIDNIEILKLEPGRVTPAGVKLIWVRLKQGASRSGARAAASTEAAQLRADEARAARASAIAGAASGRGTVGAGATGGASTVVADDAREARRGAEIAATARAALADGGTGGEPLYVVDGILVQPGDGDVIRYLPPESIDRVEVVKGAAAAALYGDRAAGGVVNITTKQGAARAGGGATTGRASAAAREAERTRTRAAAAAAVGGGANAAGITIRRAPDADGEPLYVIDGVIVPADDPAVRDLAPDRIESVEVVKGQAAVEKYGDRAAHGVITITTKAPPPR
ncbi:MAG TPA: TonB-dependent receptor plug domain-containing protein [Gemmatimonadaceae bacterium]